MHIKSIEGKEVLDKIEKIILEEKVNSLEDTFSDTISFSLWA